LFSLWVKSSIEIEYKGLKGVSADLAESSSKIKLCYVFIDVLAF
jgi:hypothetical protein